MMSSTVQKGFWAAANHVNVTVRDADIGLVGWRVAQRLGGRATKKLPIPPTQL